jgi:P27 family predicted phage terminase small subunit
MGMRGPAPKPTSIRAKEGNPGRRPLPANEPHPPLGEPEVPKYLDREARREWKRLVKILLPIRVLSIADGLELANLCQAYSLLVQAHQAMQLASKGGGSGLLMRTPAGYVQQSPLLGIINGQVEIINRISREFGLTPSSRTRIETLTESADDSLEEALCG